MHDWAATLAKGDKGDLPTLGNALIIMANDPVLAGMLAYNEFTAEHVITRSPPPAEDDGPTLPGPFPRTWQAADAGLVLGHMQRRWTYRFSIQTIELAMVTTAETCRFHPVADYLRGLVWDGVERLDTWLHFAFGCPKDSYHAAVGRKFCVAAVRRIFHPGCKFDSMPVLEGSQNIGKSRACRALAGEDWFSDDLPKDLATRDASLGLSGKWIIELGELDALIRSEVETVKAFLSRQTDRFRPPYGKHFVERPRMGVLIGTTNQNDYLRDSTGNRRFWPVWCEKAEPEWIAEVRDQLWAEAVVINADGEALWLETEGIAKDARSRQADRLAEDPWAPRVREWLREAGKSEVTTPEILRRGLSLETSQQTRSAEMRVANVLRADGWIQHIYRRSGSPVRGWFAPGTLLPNGKMVPMTEVVTEVVTP